MNSAVSPILDDSFVMDTLDEIERLNMEGRELAIAELKEVERVAKADQKDGGTNGERREACLHQLGK